MDAHSLAYRAASLLNHLSRKRKEPFRQQAHTNLVKFVILLHRFADRSGQDLYRTVLE